MDWEIRPPRIHLLAAALAAALIAGCGSGDSNPPPARPAETVDTAAELPADWTSTTNEPAGFTVGVPHGWAVEPREVATLLISPDRAVSVAISADRTDEALAAAPEEVARATIEGLPGFEQIQTLGHRPFRAHYPGVEVIGEGVRTSNGLRQRFRSIVLQRPHIAVYSILASRNLSAASPFAEQVDAIVRSLRGRPVAVP